MSRKSKSRQQKQPVAAKVYVFAVVDSHTNQRVIVAAPVYVQLIRRGWATARGIENRRDRQTGQLTEERVAVLVDHLSFRSLKPSPNGNLCFKSLLQTDGNHIGSSWESVERAWTIQVKPGDFVPQTWQGKQSVFEMRQAAIWNECSTWGVPEPQPIQTGAYLSPEAAAMAIAERQAASV